MHIHLPDPKGYGPDGVVERLKRCIETGIYGIDYTIIPRPKNEELLEKYVLNEDGRNNILKSLTTNDYEGWEYSDNVEYKKDVVHIFHREVQLIPRGIEEAKACRVKLYIKLTWTSQDGILIIISFHD